MSGIQMTGNEKNCYLSQWMSGIQMTGIKELLSKSMDKQ